MKKSAWRPGEKTEGKSKVGGRTPMMVTTWLIEVDGSADDVGITGELLLPEG